MAENKVIYFDNNATTRIAPEVFEAMTPYLTEYYGNPSSIHHFGGQVMEKVDEAKASLAALLGADPTNVIFTSCGTEASSMALFGTAFAKKRREATRILTTDSEHPSVSRVMDKLEEEGFEVVRISTVGGVLNLDQIKCP